MEKFDSVSRYSAKQERPEHRAVVLEQVRERFQDKSFYSELKEGERENTSTEVEIITHAQEAIHDLCQQFAFEKLTAM